MIALANSEDFGITPTDLNTYINAAQSPHGFFIGPAHDSAGGQGSSTGLWGTTAQFNPDEWNDFFLVVDSDSIPRQITDTLGGTLTISGLPDLLSLSGAYTIQARDPVTNAQGTAIINRVAGEIKSRLPEKYRRMIYEIDGQILVREAYFEQGTISTSYTVDDALTLTLWRNPPRPWRETTRNEAMFSPNDVDRGRTSISDYTFNGTTDLVTFQIGGNTSNDGKLRLSDQIVASYTHTLNDVPQILRQMCLGLSAWQVFQEHHGADEGLMPQYITDNKDKMDTLLTDLAENTIGIDEFDRIELFEETRNTEAEGGWNVARVDRA